MYDSEGFHVPNELDRYAIGDRDRIRIDEDGSIEILIQYQRPDDASNWLPSPKGSFQPMLRIYSPRPSALRRGIQVPAIVRID